MDKKKTGNLIREARIKKGYTQQELGDMVGVTNKAISRWETGEAFPDVSLLDTLSYTLELDINEIVLGEKKEEQDSEAALEMAQLARMEKNRKARLFNIYSIVALVFGTLTIAGIRTIVGGLYGWPVQILYYGCAICVLVASYFIVKTRKSLSHSKENKSAIVTVIAGLSVIYDIVLVCGTLTLLINGINILGLKDAQIGPFMNYQLLAIFFLNLFTALILVLEVFIKEKSVSMGLYISIAGIFLSMVYSDLLHRLISPEDFVLIFVIDTAVIFGIVIAGMTASRIIVNKALGR